MASHNTLKNGDTEQKWDIGVKPNIKPNIPLSYFLLTTGQNYPHLVVISIYPSLYLYMYTHTCVRVYACVFTSDSVDSPFTCINSVNFQATILKLNTMVLYEADNFFIY